MVPTTHQCVNKIWHPPRINVWIKYGTHHVSMCEQNMAPTTYQCVNKTWHPPRINVWTKYGTHHVSMCEQNMAPTTYQCVNKIWHPPLIKVWTKYGTHHDQCVNSQYTMKMKSTSGDTCLVDMYPPWSMSELTMVSLGCHCNGETYHNNFTLTSSLLPGKQYLYIALSNCHHTP